jgi:hypothetical protein
VNEPKNYVILLIKICMGTIADDAMVEMYGNEYSGLPIVSMISDLM